MSGGKAMDQKNNTRARRKGATEGVLFMEGNECNTRGAVRNETA